MKYDIGDTGRYLEIRRYRGTWIYKNLEIQVVSGDTGRYLEIHWVPGDTGRYLEIHWVPGDTGRYLEIKGGTQR